VKLSHGEAFGAPVLRIEGYVDPEDAPVLEQAAWEAFGDSGTRIVLDLELCNHIGSVGLGVLFSLVRWARAKQGCVIAISPRTQLFRLLQLVQLTDEDGFHVFKDLDGARQMILARCTEEGCERD